LDQSELQDWIIAHLNKEGKICVDEGKSGYENILDFIR